MICPVSRIAFSRPRSHIAEKIPFLRFHLFDTVTPFALTLAQRELSALVIRADHARRVGVPQLGRNGLGVGRRRVITAGLGWRSDIERRTKATAEDSPGEPFYSGQQTEVVV
jgi:hypothetical protein